MAVDDLLGCNVCDPWMDLSVERHHTTGEILEISEVNSGIFIAAYFCLVCSCDVFISGI